MSRITKFFIHIIVSLAIFFVIALIRAPFLEAQSCPWSITKIKVCSSTWYRVGCGYCSNCYDYQYRNCWYCQYGSYRGAAPREYRCIKSSACYCSDPPFYAETRDYACGASPCNVCQMKVLINYISKCDYKTVCAMTSRCETRSSCKGSCNCGTWVNGSCGGGSCSSTQRYQYRSCYYSCTGEYCKTETRCVSDSSCVSCSCGGWSNAGCGAGGCASYEMRQTRSCTPSGCASTSQCVSSSSCGPNCGQACSSNGCSACACNSDSRSSSYNWSTVGPTYDCHSPNCYCGKPVCSCSSWSNGSCGGGSCSALERLQTRTCTPSGCSSTSRCVSDSSCCSCGSWQNGACNAAGGCPIGQRRQTRTCTPSGCSTTSQCVIDSSCNCSCNWTDQGCGQGGCALNRMYQTGVCNYPDCATTRCSVHPNCVSSCTMTLSPSPLNVGLAKYRGLTADVEPLHATVSQVSFVSLNTSIASVLPGTDNTFPYSTVVSGRSLGETQIQATAALSPEGSCGTSVLVTVRPTAWFQTQGGNVYAGTELSDDIPSTATDPNFSLKLDNWPGMVTHQDESGVNLGEGFSSNDTLNHWLAQSKYEGKPYGSYQFFKKKFAMDTTEETYALERGDLPDQDGVYYAQSSRTLSGSSWNVGADRWLVLLVEGDVNINSNIILSKGSFLAIVATGNINFSEDITQAQGMFVADGTIATAKSNQVFEGQGVFASSDFSLARDFEDERNDTTPIETFVARPDFIMSSYKDATYNVWWFFQKWQEIAP